MAKRPQPAGVEVIPIGDVHLDGANTNTHPERNRREIAASLAAFGPGRSIVLDGKNVTRAGNGTLQEARDAGFTEVLVVEPKPGQLVAVRRPDWSPTQATAYGIADNQIARHAEVDQDALTATLRALEAEGFDLNAVGYTVEEFEATCGAIGTDGGTAGEDPGPQHDRAEELQAKWKTERGQLWLVPSLATPGKEHRLLCGDSTDAADVARVMGGEKAVCVFTDPPYGVSIGKKNEMLNACPSPAGGNKGGRSVGGIEDDDLSPDELKARLLPAFALLKSAVMAEDCTLFVTSPQGGELCMMMMMDAKLAARHVLIWKKNQPTFSMGRLDYDYQHEPILMTWGKRHKRPMLGEHTTSVWEVDKPRRSGEHPTMKPPELYVNAYLNNCDLGDVVADPYGGSGTAFVAAEQTGRLCRGIEIAPKYVAVALERLAGMGLTPRLSD